jgi:hypothetical protein
LVSPILAVGAMCAEDGGGIVAIDKLMEEQMSVI